MAKTYWLDNSSGRLLAVSDPSDSTDTVEASSGDGVASVVYPEAVDTDVTRTSTGTFTVEVTVTASANNTQMRMRLQRLNSGGTPQATSANTSYQSTATTGLKTFQLTNPALGTWATSDRLQVVLEVQNTALHGGASGPTWATGTSGSEVHTPFSVLQNYSLTCDGASYSISGPVDGSIAYPDATLSAGNWAAQGAATIHEALNEETPNDDTDYADVFIAFTIEELDLSLGSLSDPGVHTNHTISVRIWDDVGILEDWLIQLYEGTNLRAQFVAGDGNSQWITETYTLTEVEASAITDYSNLRLLVTAGAGSTSGQAKISQAQFSVPGSGGIALLKDSVVVSNVGSYTITGQDVTLTFTAGSNNFPLEVDSGSYTITGTAASLEKNSVVGTDAGVYTITGQAANLEYNRLFSVDSGSYTITGSNVNLLKDLKISVDAGSYTITGQTASLGANRIFGVDSGNYVITGQTANLLKGFNFPAETGTFSITGQTANLLKDYLFGVDSGSYVITGQDVTLIAVGDFELAVDGGVYTITGNTVNLLVSYLLSADAGNYTFTGQNTNLLTTRYLSAESDNWTINGQTITLNKDSVIQLDSGVYVIAGLTAGLVFNGGDEPIIIRPHGMGAARHVRRAMRRGR